MNRTLIGAIAILAGCNWQPRTYHDECKGDSDCAADLVCRDVYTADYFFYYEDTGGAEEYTERVCTLTCESDDDCPRSQSCNGTHQCYEGLCMETNCAR